MHQNAFGVNIYRWFEKDCVFIRACALVSSNTVIGDVFICTSTFFPRANETRMNIRACVAPLQSKFCRLVD